VVRDLVGAFVERVRDFFESEVSVETPIEEVGIYSEAGWKCSFCGSGPMQKKYPDLYRHIFKEHYRVTEEESKEEQGAGAEEIHNSVRMRDLLDEYSLERPEESTEEVELQDPEGGEDSRLNHLKRYYLVIQEEVEKADKFVIRRETHIGSIRGGHILQKFRSAVRRIPDDSLSNWEIENEGTGEYPIVITRNLNSSSS